MARYAEIEFNYGHCALEPGAYFDLVLRGVPVRFQVGSAASIVGSTVTFTQQPAPALLTYHAQVGPGNAATLQAAVRGYLDSIGSTDYVAVGTYYPMYQDENSNIVEDELTRLTIKATRFGEAYTMPRPVLSANFPGPRVKPVDNAFPLLTVVTNLDPPTLSAEGDDLICFGSDDGSIRVTVNGGVAPFTFAWKDGAATAERENLRAGSYELTLRDSGGVDPNDYDNTFRNVQGVVTRTFVITQSPRLEVVLSKTPTSASVSVSGGTPPYAYLWDDGPTTATRDALASGSYACVVTDAQQCQAETVSFEIIENNFFWSGNPITLPLDAGAAYRADPSTKPNLSFRCEVYLEQEYLSNEFTLIGSVLEQPADRDGRTTFQVQQLLARFLEHHVPAVGQRTISRADTLFRRFYLKHAEVYGSTPVPGATTTLAYNYVALGGLNFYEQQTRSYFSTYLGAVKPFLTWEVNPKPAALDQPEFLYFLVPTVDVPAFELRCTVTYADGSTATRLVATQTDTGLFEIYCLPAGYQQLALADYQGQPVASWEVFVTTEAGVLLSEKRRYLLDRRPATRRYVLYGNSLGGMSTFAATGEADHEAEVSGEEAQLALALDYDPLRGDTAVQERQLRPVLKLAGGKHLTRAQLHGLQDLLLSRRVLLLNGPRWLPGYLKTRQVAVISEGKSIQTLELELYLAREKYFTPLLPQVSASQVRAVGPESGAL